MHNKKHMKKSYDIEADRKKDKSMIEASDRLLHSDFNMKNMYAKKTFGF